MPRVATLAARARSVRPHPPITADVTSDAATDAAAERASAAAQAHVTDGAPSAVAGSPDLLPTFVPTAPATAWLAALAAASTQGEMAAVSAAPGAEREGLLLLAETARALHQLLEAVPRLDHDGRYELGARVDRMASWLVGGRGVPASAAVALCRRLGGALTAAG